ncbi:hypothetical protein Dimus_031703, partial [Dionaea muscipula]
VEFCSNENDGGSQWATTMADLRSIEAAALIPFLFLGPSNSLLLWRGVGGWTDVVAVMEHSSGGNAVHVDLGWL